MTTKLTKSLIETTALFPAGGIIMWSGSIAAIPTGWVICDGTNSTPDLRNRFIVGAGSTYAAAATGGSTDAIVPSHSHTASSSTTTSISDPGHQHLFGADDQVASQGGYNVQSGFSYDASSTTGGGGVNLFTKRTDNTNNPQGTDISASSSTSTTVNSTGVSATNANLPPYYALAYIMKT